MTPHQTVVARTTPGGAGIILTMFCATCRYGCSQVIHRSDNFERFQVVSRSLLERLQRVPCQDWSKAP